MANKSFLDKLFDPNDKTVEPHIVFIFWAIAAIITYAGLQLWLDIHAFKIEDIGVALGSILGGGGVYAGGTSMNKAAGDPQ